MQIERVKFILMLFCQYLTKLKNLKYFVIFFRIKKRQRHILTQLARFQKLQPFYLPLKKKLCNNFLTICYKLLHKYKKKSQFGPIGPIPFFFRYSSFSKKFCVIICNFFYIKMLQIFFNKNAISKIIELGQLGQSGQTMKN